MSIFDKFRKGTFFGKQMCKHLNGHHGEPGTARAHINEELTKEELTHVAGGTFMFNGGNDPRPFDGYHDPNEDDGDS